MSVNEVAVSKNFLDLLTENPILKSVNSADLARMLLHVGHLEMKEGETLFEKDKDAKYLYLITSGSFQLLSPDQKNSIEKGGSVSSGYIGEEGVLGSNSYRSSAISTSSSSVISIPTKDLLLIIEKHPEIKNQFFESYVRGKHVVQKKTTETSPIKEGNFPIKETLGWILTFGGSLLTYWLMSQSHIEKGIAYTTAIIMSAVGMWIFNLVPAFAPPIFVILMVILLDVVPPEIAIGGFASSSFFMLLSIFGVGALMVASGLTFRLSLLILRVLPSSSRWYNVGLFLSGSILTPVIPSQGGRTTIVAPFLADMMFSSDPQKKDILGANFVNSTLSGVSLLASIFLTGKPSNLIVLGLFDYQTQFAFQWLNWLFAASMSGIVLIIFYFLISNFVFRGSRKFAIAPEIIQKQLKMIGPLSNSEWSGLAAVTILIIGILTTSIHKVDIPWVSFTIMAVLMLYGFVGRNELRSLVEWPTLLFVGAIIAWLPIMSATGINTVVSNNLVWLGEYMKTNLTVFIGLLCAIIILVRFVLPEPVTVILFVTALFPLANITGVSTWLIGFIILTMSETYIFPYQSGYYIQLKEFLSSNQLEGNYDERRIILFNFLMTLGRIIAIYASLPFWRQTDII
ncbi:MAG: anion permease [Desulfobacterales bacterium]|nr:anion permease [Desulfobacterales bacterium]